MQGTSPEKRGEKPAWETNETGASRSGSGGWQSLASSRTLVEKCQVSRALGTSPHARGC